MKFFSKIIIAVFLLLIFFISARLSLAEDDNGYKLEELAKQIQEYQNKIRDLQGQQKTLASTITYLDSKIYLTQAQIAKTEKEIEILKEEIDSLSVKIGQLDKNLNELSKILNSRIAATYKSSYVQPSYLLFSSDSFASFFSKLKYLKIAQAHDRAIIIQLERQKQNYDEQKDLKEKKQKEIEALKKTLEVQTIALAQQKKSKQQLMEVTKNDEKKFQSLLAAARAEMEAIQSIIAGMGEETEVGEIKEGQKIASIILGTSACSTGTHLHLQVVKDNTNYNPASFLKSQDVDWDLCGWWPECDSQFSFSGSWNWPINGRPRITQGYGMSGYAKNGAYGGGPHTGLDMMSEDLQVKTVKDGTLYRGSIACGGGTLRYVRVKHQSEGYDTYYLHVNYY